VKIVSLIPARGGSKEIPNKNIIDVNGKPLLSYSIDASLHSKVDETWVSSDSNEIGKVAEKYGARFITRDKELANDIIMPDATLVDFKYRVDFDVLVFIQPTSPMIKSEYINQGIDKLLSENLHSVFSVTKEHWLPRWNERVEPIEWEIDNRPRRQDKETSYIENGMFYITRKNILTQDKLRYGGKMGFIEIPLHDSFQVDSEEDLELVRKIL
tara:strand:+ start:16801 stop:17439 length:639 start_codon:yes stop_codon:yes gene_type:complete